MRVSSFEFSKISLIHGELGGCCRLCGLQSQLFSKLIESNSLGKYPLSARVGPHSGVSCLVVRFGKGFRVGVSYQADEREILLVAGGLRITFKFSFKLGTIQLQQH